MLLVLVAHAFVISATHNHRIRLTEDASPSGQRIAGSGATDERTGLESNGHAQCLLCRLQRSLIADLYSPFHVNAPSAGKFARGEAQAASVHANESLRLPAGRAPPPVLA